MPIVTDEAVARAAPERAVLSAMAHGREAIGLDVARAVLAALPGLEEDRARLYFDLVGGSLNEAARIAFEALMQSNYEYQTDFARKYYGQGKAEGKAEGKVEGKVEGKAEGLIEGRLEGRVEIILELLARRFGPLPEGIQTRVRCAQEAQLGAVTERMLMAQTLEQALGSLY